MSGTNTKKKDELYAPEMPGQIDNTAVQGANQKYTAAKGELDSMSYDNFKQGSMYQGLQKSYAQQGQQAMKDTLGQVAARTGGMASSYATTAAQQSYNNYMQQLEDVARSMYNDEYSRARDKVTLAQGEYDRAYGEYRDRVGDAWTKYGAEQEQYNQDRTYNYNVDKDNKLTRDTELKALLGSEDFDWDNHDWDGDGKIGAADTDGEGTPADYLSGSSYGEDYWKAYAKGAANDRKNTRIADEKKNGRLLNSLINSSGLSLSDADQASFDEAYGDGAYEATKNMMDSTRQFLSQIHIPARGEGTEQGTFLANIERAMYALSDALPWLSSDQLFALLEKINPEVMEIYGNADTYFGESVTIHGYDQNGKPIYAAG